MVLLRSRRRHVAVVVVARVARLAGCRQRRRRRRRRKLQRKVGRANRRKQASVAVQFCARIRHNLLLLLLLLMWRRHLLLLVVHCNRGGPGADGREKHGREQSARIMREKRGVGRVRRQH